MKTLFFIRFCNAITVVNPFFGFSIAGFVVAIMIVVMVFSSLDVFTSNTSENSVRNEVNSAVNMDSPKTCAKFDDPEDCISNFASIKNNPQLCVDFIDDEKLQYDCLSNFFRSIQDKVCTYVSDNYHEQCLKDAKDFEGFI